MPAAFLRNSFPNSAWDGRVGPLVVAAASVAFMLAIITFAA